MSQSRLRPGEACLAGTCFVRQPVSQAGPAHLRQPGRASSEDHELHICLRPQRGHHLLRHGRTSRLPSSPVSQAGGSAECHHLPPTAYSPLAGRATPQHHWAAEGRPARAAWALPSQGASGRTALPGSRLVPQTGQETRAGRRCFVTSGQNDASAKVLARGPELQVSSFSPVYRGSVQVAVDPVSLSTGTWCAHGALAGISKLVMICPLCAGPGGPGSCLFAWAHHFLGALLSSWKAGGTLPSGLAGAQGWPGLL